ncbi:mitochondrial carrier [Meredithblackwellia eburnea MCA 4105]
MSNTNAASPSSLRPLTTTLTSSVTGGGAVPSIPGAAVAVAGGRELKKGSLPVLVVLAGASNAFAASFTNAFDLIKVRQQLSLSHSPAWYTTLSSMLRTEGLFSIYKGLSASLLREGLYSGIRMGGYDSSKAFVRSLLPSSTSTSTSSSPGTDPFALKLGAGMISGMIGAAIASPADLLKVRMQALNAKGTLRDHAREIISERGIKGLYKAVGPTTVRAGILTASQVGTYDHAKHLLITDFPSIFSEGLPTHLAASGIAGFVCSAASSPVDVIKVRLMNDSTRQYSNALHCAALILKNEGPAAFYKGFTMCFLRLWPHSVISLLTFEQLRKVAGLKPI